MILNLLGRTSAGLHWWRSRNQHLEQKGTSAFKLIASRNRSITTLCFLSTSASLIKDSQWGAEFNSETLPGSTALAEFPEKEFFEQEQPPLSRDKKRGARALGDFSIMLFLLPNLGRFALVTWFVVVVGFGITSREVAVNTIGGWNDLRFSDEGFLSWWPIVLPGIQIREDCQLRRRG